MHEPGRGTARRPMSTGLKSGSPSSSASHEVLAGPEFDDSGGDLNLIRLGAVAEDGRRK